MHIVLQFSLSSASLFSLRRSLKSVSVVKFLKMHYIQSSRSMSTVLDDEDSDSSAAAINNRIKGHAKQIFEHAVNSVLPRQMMERMLKFDKYTNTLHIERKEFTLRKNVYVVGIGKAVNGMARVVDDLLGDHIVKGIISVPVGHMEQMMRVGRKDLCLRKDSKILVCEGAKDNIPDEASHSTAGKIYELIKSLSKDDILLVLVSGGGSALMPMPCPPITLQEELDVIRLLAGSGATIRELNTVRANIEVLKGGGLAREAVADTVVSLILSDVIGDPLDSIASGPTHPTIISPVQCFRLINGLNVLDQMPKSVMDCLEKKLKALKKSAFDKPSSLNYDWSKVHNFLVGNNSVATEAAVQSADDLGYCTVILTNTMDGDTRKAGILFGKLAHYISMIFGRNSKEFNPILAMLEVELVQRGIPKIKINEIISAVEIGRNLRKGVCIIAGGETTTIVKGTGLGGRNQEMTLVTAPYLATLKGKGGSEFQSETHACFLSAGTDGLDGPTDAAGAVVDVNFTADVSQQGLSLQEFLENNDSYNLLREVNDGECHIKTGHTGTNVMDIQVLIVVPSYL